MLRVSNLAKSYNINPVLSGVSFSLKRGERIGLVGSNGCGKTTLLRLIAGVERPDIGSVMFTPADLRIGYLPQGLQPDASQTLGGALGLDEEGAPLLHAAVERLAAELGRTPQDERLQRRYDSALDDLAAAAQTAERAPQTLAALGLGDYSFTTPVRILSGGQKTRLALARVLLGDPQLLLLDEPTNHLDLEMLAWLEDWLARFSGAALFVSHDRAFLDRAATSILELDPETHTTRQYSGNYQVYLEEKLNERQRQWQAYQDQQEEIAQLRQAVQRLRENAAFRRGGKGDSGDKFATGFFANRTKEVIKRSKGIERRIESLQGEESVEKPHASWQVKLDFAASAAGGRDVLALDGLSVGYAGLVLLADISLTLRHGARAALVGENGAGKTTLLRTILGRIPPLAGAARLGAGVRPGYMAQEQEDLDPALTPLESIRRAAAFSETEARTFLHRFLFAGDSVFRPVGVLSYGERARLSLACLVAGGCNFLLLDEPINHLDIPSRARFEQALASFDGTVLAVVHDRFFIAGFASEIWKAEKGRIMPLDVRSSL